ncbi:MAG TPA: hypothetical protein VJ740_00995 [Hyphomicrobiaceae bacterium]|nr:hypothetical protein [Hyphomicrobiaceae bacterium]
MSTAALESVSDAPPIAHASMRGAASPRSYRDWSGLWFKLVEETWGEYVGMRGGLLQADGTTKWTFLSHAHYDGLGGFVHLLRGASRDRAIAVPIRRSTRPSWLARTGAFLRLVAQPTVPAAAWKKMDATVGPRRDAAGTAIATRLFDAAMTQGLARKAKSLGVPLNSLLLAALARASHGELDGGPARWMMPVNMRGPISLPNDTANQTGYLQIEVAANASPAMVQEGVKAALRRREHWSTWAFLNLGRIVGYAGMRAIYRLQMSRFAGRPFVGSFTNLGTWQGHGVWFVAPPVARTCPVGAGAIICDGQLSLTIEAHPAMAGGAAWSRGLMDRWVAELGA